MNTKEQLTVLSITQNKYPEWDNLLEKMIEIGRYDINNSYDVISLKRRVYKNIDHMTWKLISRMNDVDFNGEVIHTVVLVYPISIPTTVANRIRLQCIVRNKACPRITWNLIANTNSGLVTTISELENCWEAFPSSDGDREKLLKQFIIKS